MVALNCDVSGFVTRRAALTNLERAIRNDLGPGVYAALRTVPERCNSYVSPVPGSHVSPRPVGDVTQFVRFETSQHLPDPAGNAVPSRELAHPSDLQTSNNVCSDPRCPSTVRGRPAMQSPARVSDSTTPHARREVATIAKCTEEFVSTASLCWDNHRRALPIIQGDVNNIRGEHSAVFETNPHSDVGTAGGQRATTAEE